MPNDDKRKATRSGGSVSHLSADCSSSIVASALPPPRPALSVSSRTPCYGVRDVDVHWGSEWKVRNLRHRTKGDVSGTMTIDESEPRLESCASRVRSLLVFPARVPGCCGWKQGSRAVRWKKKGKGRERVCTGTVDIWYILTYLSWLSDPVDTLPHRTIQKSDPARRASQRH